RRVQYDDWLDEAKRLPVGAVTRVQHKRDGSRRPNLVIGHEPDKYWAYCHACKEGGVHTKEHVRWGERAPAESRRRDIPDDLVGEDKWDASTRSMIEGFLLSKGVSLSMITGTVAYSPTRKRVFIRPMLWSGYTSRDLTGRSAAKWVHHPMANSYVLEEALGTVPNPDEREGIVLTEDILSMYKVRWAILPHVPESMHGNVFVGTTLGTAASPALLE